MSGGHFDYMYENIRDMYVGEMEDDFINRFMDELCTLLKSLEWYKSGDTSKETYHDRLEDFKDKWFENNVEVKKEIVASIKVDAIQRILAG